MLVQARLQFVDGDGATNSSQFTTIAFAVFTTTQIRVSMHGLQVVTSCKCYSGRYIGNTQFIMTRREGNNVTRSEK